MRTPADLTTIVAMCQVEGYTLTQIRVAVKKDVRIVLKEVVTHVGERLAKWYPENADYFTGLDFNAAFTEVLQQNYPTLGVEEISLIFDGFMSSYKYHTAPRIPDLIKMVEAYEEAKAEAREIFHEEMKAVRNRQNQIEIDAIERDYQNLKQQANEQQDRSEQTEN